jgi:hypothetical protein
LCSTRQEAAALRAASSVNLSQTQPPRRDDVPPPHHPPPPNRWGLGDREDGGPRPRASSPVPDAELAWGGGGGGGGGTDSRWGGEEEPGWGAMLDVWGLPPDPLPTERQGPSPAVLRDATNCHRGPGGGHDGEGLAPRRHGATSQGPSLADKLAARNTAPVSRDLLLLNRPATKAAAPQAPPPRAPAPSLIELLQPRLQVLLLLYSTIVHRR